MPESYRIKDKTFDRLNSFAFTIKTVNTSVNIIQQMTNNYCIAILK